jgi:hypothetical protein
MYLTPIPEKFKPYLGAYGGHLCDGFCGEVIGWGHPVLAHLGEDLWREIQSYGSMECVTDEHLQSKWYLIVKRMTREDAIEKYGPVTDEEWGPRGGWKSVTFGKKKFMSRSFKSERPAKGL